MKMRSDASGDNGEGQARPQAESLITVPEAAALLRTPESTLRYWRHTGLGPRSIRLGRRVFYREGDLLTWIEAEAARTARGGSEA